MKYWLTVHWPQLQDRSVRYPLRVWLQDGTQSAGNGLDAGDRVLIYETKFGPTRLLPGVGGIKREAPSLVGRQGIIIIAEAIGPLTQDLSFEKIEYADGSQRWWCWHAPLRALAEDGFVPRTEVNRVLGYSPNYLFRGFGTFNSGLKELTALEYSALVEVYRLHR